jgi:hypothetical protein
MRKSSLRHRRTAGGNEKAESEGFPNSASQRREPPRRSRASNGRIIRRGAAEAEAEVRNR